ncbi:MAG: RadC family protein [Salinibacter sp.]
MSSQTEGSPDDPYQIHLFDRLPLYSTRLVRETEFTYPDRFQVTEPSEVATILRDYFRDKDREEFLTVLLDTANTVIGLSQISVGGLSSSVVEPRQIFKTAILANAAAVILAHQHPSGNPEPSHEDINITRQLVEAGEIMDVPVHDHLIITEVDYVSLADRGVIR